MGMHHRRSTDHDDGDRSAANFDIALWGYDRRQVDRCIDELAAELTSAVSQLQQVEELQEQLCRANIEIAELRRQLAESPPWEDRLAAIMAEAEQLRSQAARDAGTVRERAGSAS